jgi:hypothetical protein
MKFRGDDHELLRSLWSAVQRAGGSPSINMIQKMARLAGASFNDKAARTVLFGDRENIGITEAAPQYLSTITEAAPKRDATKRSNGSIDHGRLDATEVAPQHLPTITEAAPRCGFGEADENTVVDIPTPNLFDGLVDPSELKPVNDAATLRSASGIAPQEVLAPGIARLMELSKKAKAVNAATAIRSAAKPPPKAIRYIFPSEHKTE